MPKGQANFMLTYTASTDSFHGVFTDSNGSVGFWDNPGPANGTWTEYGYDVANRESPNTRALFFGITPTHYAFRFWSIASRSDAGKFLESDSCTKVAR
jgi:hypothetical protein